MLLKKFIMGLCTVLVCSHAHAMNPEPDFTTPIHSKARKPKVINTKKADTDNSEEKFYTAEIQRLWGLFEQNGQENGTIDIETAKFVFQRVAKGMTQAQQFEVLHHFLAKAMGPKDFTEWLCNIEQTSDGTPKSKYGVFKAIVNAETPN